VKLLLIQKDINNLDYRKFLDDAVSQDPDAVCFPELATSGCLYEGGEGVDFDTLTHTLSNYSFSVLIGFPREHEGRFYNSYAYIRDGEYQVYNKINLFEPMNEPNVYTPGETPGLIETQFGRLGVAICYDLRFPELFRQLADGGVKVIFVPAAFPRVRIADWQELIVQRALETGLHVVGINAVGDDGVNEFGGCSMVADPSGEILAQADETTEQVLAVEI
jgi:predicted amidohydrolase